MKRDDLAIVIVSVVFSTIVASIASKYLSDKNSLNQNVRTVNVIQATFATPSTQYFNSNSIDPTQLITIGANNNEQPFTTTN